MRNPIKWVKGWRKTTKRYYFLSVLISAYLLYRTEMLTPIGTTQTIGRLISQMMSITFMVLLFALVDMLLRVVISGVVHTLVHWLEDESD